MKKYITLIGSRETPDGIIEIMEVLAEGYAKSGYIIRSGGAAGADNVVTRVVPPESREIYIPWDSFSGLYHNGKDILRYDFSPRHKDATATYVDLMGIMEREVSSRQAVVKLHSRNVMQILGYDLDTPSEFVICWTPGGELRGGTATAIALANLFEIEVLNLGAPGQLGILKKQLEEIKNENK